MVVPEEEEEKEEVIPLLILYYNITLQIYESESQLALRHDVLRTTIFTHKAQGHHSVKA